MGTADYVREKEMCIRDRFLNHNKEGRKFEKQDLCEWTIDAITKFITTMSILRYEAESDPN